MTRALATTAIVLLAAVPRHAGAQGTSATADTERLPRWGFSANFGTGTLGGDFKPPLETRSGSR